MNARELITPSLMPLRADDTVAFAIGQMEEFRISHLPVVDGSEFLGVVSDANLLAMSDPEEAVGEAAVLRNGVSVSGEQHLFDVIKVGASQGLTVIPVVNDRNQYLGMISLTGLMSQLLRLFDLNTPGGIIVLEFNQNDYTLTEIAHIVESNDAKILGLYVTPFPDSTRIEVTIKVNRIDLAPLLQAFFRYNYTVKASWSFEESYHEGLRDRYDALMNYLKI